MPGSVSTSVPSTPVAVRSGRLMNHVCGRNSVVVEVSPYSFSTLKRLLDIVGVLLAMGPAMAVMALVAAAVLVADGWPVVLVQRRVGKGGSVFGMPKFRTMRNDPVSGEPQPTRLGAFLRRHRLDELPQLFTVLTGRMSLVGPRPELVEIVSEYRRGHRRRLRVRPGLTGLWQLRASRRLRIHQAMGYDLHYIRRATLGLDLKILAMTVPFLIAPGEAQV